MKEPRYHNPNFNSKILLQSIHKRKGLSINKAFIAKEVGGTENNVKWQIVHLTKYGLIERVGWGEYILTKKGLALIN